MVNCCVCNIRPMCVVLAPLSCEQLYMKAHTHTYIISYTPTPLLRSIQTRKETENCVIFSKPHDICLSMSCVNVRKRNTGGTMCVRPPTNGQLSRSKYKSWIAALQVTHWSEVKKKLAKLEDGASVPWRKHLWEGGGMPGQCHNKVLHQNCIFSLSPDSWYLSK